MIGAIDTYYQRPEVSNSDLSALEFYFMNKERQYDLTQAYRFGNLIDAMITEPERCDHLNLRVDDEQFSREEWDKAKRMMQAFFADPLCKQFHSLASGQSVMVKNLQLEYLGVDFSLPVRCKFDLWMPSMGWGADIKSTTATTQAQFEAVVSYFNYDKQRAFYMDIAGSDRDMLIGISKVNQKIFKVPISRGDALYQSGREKYLEWAFKYWCLFHQFGDGFTA